MRQRPVKGDFGFGFAFAIASTPSLPRLRAGFSPGMYGISPLRNASS